jgi:hypothetical protein
MSTAKESDSPASAVARTMTAPAIVGAGMVRRGEVELPPAKMSAASRSSTLAANVAVSRSRLL